MVGRDVLDAPRPLNALGNAHGNATCTRAAGDVGPYHASPMSTPHVRSTPMVGRDVLDAPRPWDAHGTPTGTPTGTPHVRGPPGTSAPTMHAPLSTPPRPVRTHGRARRPRRAAPIGRPWNAHGNATCTRAAGDVGPYHTPPLSTPHGGAATRRTSPRRRIRPGAPRDEGRIEAERRQGRCPSHSWQGFPLPFGCFRIVILEPWERAEASSIHHE